jgi:23S rRNA-/tRNA-specific pseudouridylate synthase
MGANDDKVEASGGPAYITTTGEASTSPTIPISLSDPPILVTRKFAGATCFAYHGLQHVVPYPYVFTVRVKPQWRGQGLREVLVREFPSYPPEHYDLLFRAGLVSVGGEVANPDYRVGHQDRISTTITRHELPVRCLDAIRVLERTPDLYVVDKPHSIPAHPSGRFRINSLLTMVEAQVGERLFCVNRLDRLTSGLVLLARYSSLFSPHPP